MANNIIDFIKEFKIKYPNTKMLAERAIFPCAFTKEQLKKYSKLGGLRSKCGMEFTIYNNGIALCPPARDLIKYRKFNSVLEFLKIEKQIRKEMNKIILKPSFDCCKNCNLRENLSCNGGCLGYKL